MDKQHDYRNRELVHETAIIFPGVSIGKGTRIGPYAVIGANPEHRDFWNREYMGVTIGENCYIGTGVTIDSGTLFDTTIGDNVIILRNAHIGHDAIVEDDCEISANAIVGGHVKLMYASVLGMGAMTKQYVTVGRCSMIGMGAVAVKSIPDGEIHCGVPAKFMKKNIKRLEKYGY